MENAYSLFSEIIEGGFSRITLLIEQGQEENLFIDFKEKKDPSISGASKDDRKIYAKALSGFSNAAGGLIIWGVEARKIDSMSPDIAVSQKPIRYLKKFLTDLNTLAGQALVPLNPGIRNEAIYINDDLDSDTGFVVTYVPDSELPPHRAMFGDNTYYTRAGDSFFVMEHHMLEDAFGRRHKPKIEIFFELNKEFKVGDRQIYCINVGIKNTGKHIATYPAIMLKLLSGLQYSISILEKKYKSSNLKSVNEKKSGKRTDGLFFTGGIDDIVYPNTYLELTKLTPNDEWCNRDRLISFAAEGKKLVFEYELYAAGCKSVKDKVEIDAEDIMDLLGF